MVDSKVSKLQVDKAADKYTVADHDEIAVRAYECWKERGCPEGSPEVDWLRAEEELTTMRARTKAAAV